MLKPIHRIGIFGLLASVASLGCAAPDRRFEDRFEVDRADPTDTEIFIFGNVRSNHDPDTLRSKQRRPLEDIVAAAASLRPGDSKERVYDALGDPSLYSTGYWVYFDVTEDGMIGGDDRADNVSEIKYVQVHFDDDGGYRSQTISGFAIEVGGGL